MVLAKLSNTFGMVEMEKAAVKIVANGMGTFSIRDFLDSENNHEIVGFGNLIAYGWIKREDEDSNDVYRATPGFWERVNGKS